MYTKKNQIKNQIYLTLFSLHICNNFYELSQNIMEDDFLFFLVLNIFAGNSDSLKYKCCDISLLFIF